MKQIDEPPGGLSTLYVSSSQIQAQLPMSKYNGEADVYFAEEKLRIDLVTELEECKKLWDIFSPYNSLFDTWIFRYIFYQAYQYDPYFVVLRRENTPVAVLPLWYDNKKNRYEWFGSSWPEDNIFYVEDPKYISLLLYIAPRPISLSAIHIDPIIHYGLEDIFESDIPKYILDLSSIQSVEEYLAPFKKKQRYNFRRDHEHISRLNPEIIYDDFSHYEDLMTLSIARGRITGELSDFEDDPVREGLFRNLLEIGLNSNEYKVRMISVKIQGKVVAVDLNVIYKSCYYGLKSAYNSMEHNGLGIFMIGLNIQDALTHNCTRMDVLQGDFGYKDKWFRTQPLFKFSKI